MKDNMLGQLIKTYNFSLKENNSKKGKKDFFKNNSSKYNTKIKLKKNSLRKKIKK